MKPEIKEMWVNALPNYEQGTGALRNGNGFCCLGVLCDLYVKETGNLSWELANDGYSYNISEESNFLPYEVSEWAGLNQRNPSFIDPDHPEAEYNDNNKVPLAQLNDIGYDFKQIAELIQKHF